MGKIIEKIYSNTSIMVIKKSIKNVHLKVYRDMTVRCSFPLSASEEYIDKFLIKRIDWVQKQLAKYKEANGADNLECVRDGSCVQMLGKDYRVFIREGKQVVQEEDGKNIVLYTRWSDDEKRVQNQFAIWWRKKATEVFHKILDELFGKVIAKYGIGKPRLKLRAMKTMWGSYAFKSNTITINDYLLKANLLQIEYVILHELTHTRFRQHNIEFYNFLTIHMPDWKERKKVLDTQIAQGIM